MLLSLVFSCASAWAQQSSSTPVATDRTSDPAPTKAPVTPSTPVTASVVDAMGSPVSGARVLDCSGSLLGTTDAAGRLALAYSSSVRSLSCPVTIEAQGFSTRKAQWQAGIPITLDLSSVRENISVTAYRTPMGDLESPVSTRLLTQTNLQQAAPITLDGQLRLVPGVETFRRSSSLVANPSSQGLSLRGLGSTSASRTLVTQDDVPLNDAFGGWIHWEELPELSIRSVELVRGGASDLYGSSAIGGVVNVIPIRPTGNFAELNSSYGSENTYDDSLLVEGHHGRWGAMATGGVIGTDGFTQLSPDVRGLVDIPSNVHAQNGLILADHQQGNLRLFLRGSIMNEARGNGTPVQTNGTRLWRYSTGSDWTNASGGALTFRAYGSAEHYRQTFSTIASDRNSESLNRFVRTPDDEMGAVLHWSQPLAPGLLLVAGADTHDVRALDEETTYKGNVTSPINLSDRQRQTGAYAELLYIRQAWTISASGRIDWFSNFDGVRIQPAQAPLAQFGERVFDPRLGISRKLGQHFALSGNGFRAYRAPTPNELYRSTQVGSLLTLPNNNLRSERATGWETGIAMEQRWGTLRTSYFWTRVNRPITALTTDPTSNPIQLTRENLGRIESRGISADLELQPARWMTINTGYQYTNATVTQYAQQPQLVGNWIPQVAHQMGTLQIRGYRRAIGTLSLQGKISGRQFDDDANTYLLRGYFKLDAYASHDIGQRWEIYSSGENLFDRSIDVGRTPLLTLGTPRVERIGFRLKLGAPGK
ncbi:TonB-dependent receptor [Acidicapsa ligni]|uniref:TonB-dependent receptor n=1 Tax=Acidicapsa ligni TaxID=542300 RepID=UPI0021E09D39|nr:TonB-dependent receptor [Acidicapsa ligni]